MANSAFHRFFFASFAVIFAAALAGGCGDAAVRDNEALQNDAPTLQRLEAINARLVSSNNIRPEDFIWLKEIEKRYPKAELVRRVMRNALVARSDWQAVIDFFGTEEGLGRDDRMTLAGAHYKLGNFEKTATLLEPLKNSEPRDVPALTLLARSKYAMGDASGCIAILSPIEGQLSSSGTKDELALLGLAYLDQQNFDEAIRVFKSVQELDPTDIASANGLSRAFYAKGDMAKADEYRKRTEAAQSNRASMEIRGRNFVQQSYRLEAAWADKNYEEVVRLCREMLATAEGANRQAVYQYLVLAYRALGRDAEAEAAANEARKTAQIR